MHRRSRFRALKIALVAALVLFVAASALAWSPAMLAELPFVGETQYFGLYIKKAKVGWRSTTISDSGRGEIVVENKAAFTQKFGGAVISMESLDRRTFDKKSGKLTLLDYQMKGPTGVTSIRGISSGKTLTLTTRSGGQMSTETLTLSPESLDDMLAVELAIVQGRITGETEFSVPQFDPSVKKVVTLDLTVLPKETRLYNGVAKEVYPVSGQITELGVPVSALYDAQGRLLQSNMSFLEAVWESKEQATSKQALSNLIEPLIVKPPTKTRFDQRPAQLRATFAGVDARRQLNTSYQQWTPGANGATFTIATPIIDPKKAQAMNAPLPEELKLYLARTARIQTDDAAIAAQAATLKADAKGSVALAESILHWVYDNMERRYTPTFSNASEAMKTRVGDCGEHAVLFVALARAAGLPAREVVGLIWSNEMGGYGFHAWAEVWLGEWVPVDPSWNQFPADAGHVAFAFGGMDKQAEIIALMDSIELTALEAK